MHQEAFNGGVAAFEEAVRTGACPYLSELGDVALGEVRGVYEQLDAGNYDALEALAERLASAMEQPVTMATKPEVVEPQPESLTRMDWAASKPRDTRTTTKQEAPKDTQAEAVNPVPPPKHEAVDNGAVKEAAVRPVSPPPEAASPPVNPEVPLPLRPPEKAIPDPVAIAEKPAPVRAEPLAPIVAAKTHAPPLPKLQELYQDPSLPTPIKIIKTEPESAALQAPQIEHPPEPAPAKIAAEEPASEPEDTPAPVLIASENDMIAATEAEEGAWPAWPFLEQPTEWIPEAAIDTAVMEVPTDVGPMFAENEAPANELAPAEEITLPPPENLVVPPVYARMTESLQTLTPEKDKAVQPVIESLAEVVTQIKELQFIAAQPEAQDVPVAMTLEREQVPTVPVAALVEAEQKLTELCEELFVLLGLPQDEAVLVQFKHFIVQADDLDILLAVPTRYAADGEGTHEFLRWPLKIMRQFVQFVQDKLERLHASLGYAAMYSPAV